MIIGMILDNVFPPDPRVENEAITLIEGGHEVHLFCIDYSQFQEEHEVLNGINVHRKKLPKHLYRFSALAYTIPYYHIYLKKSLTVFIKKNKIEALHIHDIQVARSVFSVNKKFNLPVILDLHENRPEIMKYYMHVNTTLGKLLIKPNKWKKYEYRYIKQATKIIVVTNEAKQYYIDETLVDENNLHVVPNTVRPDFYTNYKIDESIISRYKKHFTVLYLGETGIRRGLKTVINSLKYLIPVIPDIKLVIVGNSKTDNILKNLVVKNKWEDYVDFLGWNKFNLFQSFILASDIGICPIHRNLHHDTTYANKIFQYMAFGKPIIVSNSKAQQKIVEQFECGLVFEDRNAEDFAKKLIAVFQNKKLYNNLSDNALKAIKESLNWSILSKELINLYKEI